MIAHSVNRVYLQRANRSGLLHLLAYAQAHHHSAAWIPAITLLLQRGGHYA
jgi:hypothetical protein